MLEGGVEKLIIIFIVSTPWLLGVSSICSSLSIGYFSKTYHSYLTSSLGAYPINVFLKKERGRKKK